MLADGHNHVPQTTLGSLAAGVAPGMPLDGHGEVLETIVIALAAGVTLVVLARKLNVSAIVLLLVGGVVLGPVGVGIVRPDSLGPLLPAIVSLSIGLILFEGGLTLDLRGYQVASSVILKLLSLGVLITWLTTATGVAFLFGHSSSFALLAGSLVIVTGPTVLVPLLKRIKVQPVLHSILHWEGVLIDPIGVFVAILCFEWATGFGGQHVLANFGLRVLVGLGAGGAAGLGLGWLIRRQIIDEDMIDIVPLAAAALVFGIAEAVASESGLLATTVAGFVLGALRPAELKRIRRFKGAITDLLIGTLFILLAARLQPDQFRAFGVRGALLVLGVMLVVRPLNIFVCTAGESLRWNQRAFLSWVAPRGIVAASMSSLFALRLQERGVADAKFIETFTYSVIVATILAQGSTAGWLAKRLKLQRPAPTGWLIVGASVLAREAAAFIARVARVPVALIDLNPRLVREARAAGLRAVHADARDVAPLQEEPDFQGLGNLLTLTDNEDLNSLLCHRWSEVFGTRHVFGWHSGIGTAGVADELADAAVWRQLPRPTALSGDLGRRRAHLSASKVADDESPLPTGTLMVAWPNNVVLDPDNEERPSVGDEAEALVLVREGGHLPDAMRPELFVRTKSTRYEDLLAELIERLVSVAPKLPAERMKDEMLEREKVFPSAIGRGVAIPHTYEKAVPARLCAVAQVPAGLEMDAPDGAPIRLVFMPVGPPGDPEGHLALLAEIAKLVADERVRNKLMEADSFDEMLALIRAQQRARG